MRDIYDDRTANFLKYLQFLEADSDLYVPPYYDEGTSEAMQALHDAWLLYAHHDPRDFIELEVITDEDYAFQDH